MKQQLLAGGFGKSVSKSNGLKCAPEAMQALFILGHSGFAQDIHQSAVAHMSTFGPAGEAPFTFVIGLQLFEYGPGLSS